MSLSYDNWADALREGELLGVRCADCTATYGTPLSVCDECSSRKLEPIELRTEGELYSVTRIDVPPVGFDGPYHVAIVELGTETETETAVRLMARIKSAKSKSQPTIGTTVVLSGVIEEDTSGYPAPVFAVTESE